MRESDSHDQLSNIPDQIGRNLATCAAEMKIDDDDWIISIMEEIPNIAASKKQCLPKVPRELREMEQMKGFFDPRVVSIGPYHHGKPELKAAELLKKRAACKFIADSNRKPQEFYNRIQQVASEARKCYLEGSTDAYDDIAFARMMLLDGCFVLHVMDAVVCHQGLIDEAVKDVGVSDLRRISVDIMLLENQLPFLVLQELIGIRYHQEGDCKGEGEKLIENFILKFKIDKLAKQRENTYKDEREQPFHLLQLMRKRFLGTTEKIDQASSSSPAGKDDQTHGGGGGGGGGGDDDGGGGEIDQASSSSPPGKDDQTHGGGGGGGRSTLVTIIPCYCCWLSKRGHTKRKTDPYKDVDGYSFRSATELKARGIHFRPSTTYFLNEITFTSRFGYGLLTLPQIAFGWRIKYNLLNMMAYELAPATHMDLRVCSYVYFMNSLINGAEDVIELRSHNIIHNFYGTDEEVAKTFNSMAIGGAYVSYDGPIKDVNDQIQEHYNSRTRTWWGQLLHNYFNTPWSVIAFFAATFALVLTLLQTYFQISPPSSN